MAKPAKAALAKEREDRRKSRTLKDNAVWNFVVPADSKEASQAAKMEAVESSPLN